MRIRSEPPAARPNAQGDERGRECATGAAAESAIRQGKRRNPPRRAYPTPHETRVQAAAEARLFACRFVQRRLVASQKRLMRFLNMASVTQSIDVEVPVSTAY